MAQLALLALDLMYNPRINADVIAGVTTWGELGVVSLRKVGAEMHPTERRLLRTGGAASDQRQLQTSQPGQAVSFVGLGGESSN